MIVGIAGMSLSFYFHIKSDKENPPT
jgi:hypothetical protein